MTVLFLAGMAFAQKDNAELLMACFTQIDRTQGIEQSLYTIKVTLHQRDTVYMAKFIFLNNHNALYRAEKQCLR